jgi:hypothetical protein
MTLRERTQECSGILMSLDVYITVLYRNIKGKLLCEDQMSRNYSSTIVAVPSCLKYFRYLFFDGFRRLADVRWEFPSSRGLKQWCSTDRNRTNPYPSIHTVLLYDRHKQEQDRTRAYYVYSVGSIKKFRSAG